MRRPPLDCLSVLGTIAQTSLALHRREAVEMVEGGTLLSPELS
ncbi:MAG: hypothetical protein U0939_10300 [Pirellulales bacterium]